MRDTDPPPAAGSVIRGRLPAADFYVLAEATFATIRFAFAAITE
jgi:hypothetical protein